MANSNPGQHKQLAMGEKVTGMKKGGKVVQVKHVLKKKGGGGVKSRCPDCGKVHCSC